jgi:hypothetical protein
VLQLWWWLGRVALGRGLLRRGRLLRLRLRLIVRLRLRCCGLRLHGLNRLRLGRRGRLLVGGLLRRLLGLWVG